MELIAYLGLIFGSSWASGINLYLTAAGLGIAHRFEWLALPGELELLSHPLIITLALVLYGIEFLADKFPYVDSAWDSVHTVIRPLGAFMIVYFAGSEYGEVAQMATALAGGAIALDSHVMKASTRAAVNMSPEPVTNIAASVTEDVAVAGSLWLMIQHPLILVALVIGFIALSFWLIPKLFRFVKGIFSRFFGNKSKETTPTSS